MSKIFVVYRALYRVCKELGMEEEITEDNVGVQRRKMSLFSQAINNREKLVSKAVKKMVRASRKKIKESIKEGKFECNVNLDTARISRIDFEFELEVYSRVVHDINIAYNGEVKADIENYGCALSYKRVRMKIVKV